MFVVIKDGREVAATHYFADALGSLLRAEEDIKHSVTKERLEKHTFAKVIDENEKSYDLTLANAKRVGKMLDLIDSKGKMVRERGYHDTIRIMRIMSELEIIKKIL